METSMRKWNAAAGLALAATLLVSGVFAQSKGGTTTLQGTITDTMCGVKHGMMQNTTDKQCTIACVKGGSSYGLVVGDKVYTLEGKAGDLEKFAGAKAKVTGTLDKDTLKVTSVGPAS